MINDGYGDDPVRTEMFFESYLDEHERLLRLKVADRLRGNSAATDIWEDLLNEGRIVQWDVLSKRPDAPAEYVSAAMSHRITECLMRGTWTGMETHRGRATDPLRRPLRDRSSVNDETLRLDEVLSSGDWVDDVVVAYHQGQIAQALSALTLTQREIVFLKFWGGWSNAEIAAHQGRKPANVESSWRTQIKPRLAQELVSLSGLC